MSFVKALGNISSNTLAFTLSNEIHPEYIDVYLGFCDGNKVTIFDELKFGYKIKLADAVIQEGSFPQENNKYISSDQEFMVCERVETEPSTEYELYVWAENGGVLFESSKLFTTPPITFNDVCWWDGENWQPAMGDAAR